MKISDVIGILSIILETKGDVDCVCEDGSDPSDAQSVNRVEFYSDFRLHGDLELKKPVVKISS